MDAKGNSSAGKPPAGPAAAGKRSGAAPDPAAGQAGVPPCGACKFLRRRCGAGCVFAPYFGTEQGPARFAAVHKVFGASNVSKLLLHVPAERRYDAVATVCYEAQARLSDPVYGCVATILALQQQVASLQAELSIVQSLLINSRLAAAGVLQCSQSQLVAAMQPAYSNNSSSSTNMVNISSSIQPSGLSDGGAVSRRGCEPLQLSQQSNDEGEEESGHHVVFSNGCL